MYNEKYGKGNVKLIMDSAKVSHAGAISVRKWVLGKLIMDSAKVSHAGAISVRKWVLGKLIMDSA